MIHMTVGARTHQVFAPVGPYPPGAHLVCASCIPAGGDTSSHSRTPPLRPRGNPGAARLSHMDGSNFLFTHTSLAESDVYARASGVGGRVRGAPGWEQVETVSEIPVARERPAGRVA